MPLTHSLATSFAQATSEVVAPSAESHITFAVALQRDRIHAVLVGGGHVHVNIREGRQKDGWSLDHHGDLDNTRLEWRKHGLPGDVSDAHWKGEDTVGGGIIAAVRGLCAPRRPGGDELETSAASLRLDNIHTIYTQHTLHIHTICMQ